MRMPVVAELARQVHERGGGPAERIEGRDLRPDVDVQADELDAVETLARAAQSSADVADRNAELVALQPGRDVRMAPGVDVRVHPKGDLASASGARATARRCARARRPTPR